MRDARIIVSAQMGVKGDFTQFLDGSSSGGLEFIGMHAFVCDSAEDPSITPAQLCE